MNKKTFYVTVLLESGGMIEVVIRADDLAEAEEFGEEYYGDKFMGACE